MIGIVELAEQPGLRINAIIAADPAEVRIGQPVRMRVVDLGTPAFACPSSSWFDGGLDLGRLVDAH
ncbi:hypothetical protein I553_4812 [Mycobacterium xenopi 4042]|uniref:Uncharacterized protein n=1 Tax=Mycobacterium xenopi 4042 TaxID=1299334 RepID=X8AI56_MYCXE|nr:hypothetical protein I553_4812 [Mycobacterium xenopi 4042]